MINSRSPDTVRNSAVSAGPFRNCTANRLALGQLPRSVKTPHPDQGTLKKHGDQVIVEGDRGAHNDAGLTQWHYFCVVNIRGTLYVADAHSGMVRADIQAYIDWLKTTTYKFTTKRVEALTMEEWRKRRNP